MPFEIQWSRTAIDDLRKIDTKNTDRITKKVDWFCKQTKPLTFAKTLGGKFEDIYRFRIGDYRVLFEIIDGNISVLMILRVKHRREVYK